MVDVVELGPGRADELAALYGTCEWWAERDPADVRRALRATDLAVGLEDDGRLVASARVLTDGVYYAKVYDVIVHADRRGEGLGRRLMEAVVDHPDLAAVDHPALLCEPDLVPFYERVGFEENDHEFVHMLLEP